MLGDTPALANCLLGSAMSSSPSSLDYAGDVGAAEAWDMLKSNANAQLVDVRTVAEWNFVGLPDLAALGIRQCTGCGCTDAVGCSEGCCWVGPLLCSSCGEPADG